MATGRVRPAADAHVESDSLRDVGHHFHPVEFELPSCRTAAAPALLPLCRWLLHHKIFKFALRTCDCIVEIATAAASGSENGMHAFSHLSNGAIVAPGHSKDGVAQEAASFSEAAQANAAAAADSAAAVGSDEGETAQGLKQPAGLPEEQRILRHAGFVRVCKALLQMAREEVQQWDLEAWNVPLPNSSRGGPAVQEIRRTLALGVMLDPDIARFFTLLGDALFAVSSAANSNGQPLQLSECTGSIATMLQLLGSLKAQCKVWSTTSSGALQKFTPAVCHILLGLAPLLQQYADGAAAQREHVHTLEGTLSVQHAMGLADAMAKLAAIMIRSAAARRAHATLQLRGETQQH